MDALIWSIGPFIVVFLILMAGGAFSARDAGPSRRPRRVAPGVLVAVGVGVGAGLLGLLIGR